MTAAFSYEWLNSSRQNPCPICGRTKDGDCRISADGKQVICHHPKDLEPGQAEKGWAFTHNTSDGRAGHFTIDKPKNSSGPARVLPFPGARIQATSPSPEPSPITGPIGLAWLPEPEKEPPSHLPNGTWLEYSSDPWQRVKVVVDANGRKKHPPHHIGPDGEVVAKAGLHPWPLWHEADALAHGRGLWIAEAEGEKCARWLQAGGLVAVSQPGHAHKVEQIAERYQRLVDAGVEGIVYLEDNDDEGQRRSQQSKDAAAAVGLPLLVLPATEVWPGLPEKGSIDDAPGTAAERVAALEASIPAAIQRQQQQAAAEAELSDEEQGDNLTDPLDEWDNTLRTLVDPAHPSFEKNIIRRQIRAATAASEFPLRVSPDQIRARLIQKQRELLAGTGDKGVGGGTVARFAEKRWLISNLIAEGCLTGIAAFAKVGKTKCLTEVAASLIFQQPFMGNPDWQTAPGPHKLILWWTDQPGVDSAAYLKARGLMDPDGTLHPQIVRLYTQEDNLCWDDQGLDELISITTANPDAALLTDSFYANVQPIYGSDQAPESGGALIDVQTFASRYTKAHICAFHSPQETGPVGVAAMRGHGSAKGVVSSTISLHFLEHKCPSGSGKWVADKDNPHRRMVTEGRLPYSDLLVKLDGAAGTWTVIGKFQQALADLQSDDRKGAVIDGLTSGQRETLEWVVGAMGVWKDPSGVTVHQVAACKVQQFNRPPTKSEEENTRKQIRALVKDELLSETKKGATSKFLPRS